MLIPRCAASCRSETHVGVEVGAAMFMPTQRCQLRRPLVARLGISPAKSHLEEDGERLALPGMFVRGKIINGRYRNYAVFSYREGGKVRQRQIYLGKCSTIAERILDLEDDLTSARFTVSYYVRKIGDLFYAPRPYLLEARASAERKLAAVKAALERLKAVAKEHGLQPTKAERAGREAARLKREEEIKRFFSRYIPRRRVVPTPLIAQ